MRYASIFGALALLGGCLTGSTAMAADWQIATVSGKAFRSDGATWVRAAAHDQLALGDSVKTLGSGTVTLVRAGVTVTVAPNSQLQIDERQNGKFTDLLQAAGSADVEVDPAKHIRLAVETPYMAAVVKGTVFTVATFKGYSETAVKRGRVAVIDVNNRLEADVTAGQKATSGEGQPLSLSGSGKLATAKAFNGKVMVPSVDGTLTEKTNGAGKSVTSPAGGTSEGAGKSESSKAGGNSDSHSGSNSGHGNSGSNGNSDHGNSDHGNSGSNGNSDHGNSDHGNSGSNGNSDHGNSGHGNSGSNNAGGNGKGNSGHESED